MFCHWQYGLQRLGCLLSDRNMQEWSSSVVGDWNHEKLVVSPLAAVARSACSFFEGATKHSATNPCRSSEPEACLQHCQASQ